MRRPAAYGLLPAFLAGVGVLAFTPALEAFFVADDFFLLDAVISGGPLGVWTTHSNFFRPLASASLWLDHRAWGLVPLPFHATNLVLHLLTSLAAGSAARRLFARSGATEADSSVGGLLAGLFFLLLPAHAEPVNWISARPDLLAGLLALVSLALALRHEESGRPLDAALAAAAFGGSLLSKESGVTWPVVVLLLLLPASRARRGTRGARFLSPALFLAVLLAYLPLRAACLGGLIRGYGANVHLRLAPFPIADNLLRFLGRSLVPDLGLAEALGAGLSAAPLLRLETWLDRAAGLGVLAAFFALALRGRGASRRIALPFLAAFLVAALPTANLGIGAGGPEGERFLYLPSFLAAAGVAGAFTGALSSARSASGRLAAASALTAGWGGALLAANLSWRSAGDLSHLVVFGLEGAPMAEETVLLALPDNVRGAYVQRSSLPRALALFGQGRAWGRLVVLSSTDLSRPLAIVSATRTGECWAVTAGSGSRFRALFEPRPGSGIETVPGPGGGGYRACAVENRPGRRWALVSGGKLVTLAGGGERTGS